MDRREGGMSILLRPYQSGAIEAVMGYWDQGPGNPLVDLATGTGKSIVIAKLTRDLLTSYPDLRVLMLVHVKELVQQNFNALLKLWPDAPVGIYSAGLGRRDAHHRITFASIQSVYNKAHLLGRRDLVLIDEAHLVPSAGNGMYRKLLEDLRGMPDADVRVCGFTATPFRLDTGRLDAGDDRIFDGTVYNYGIARGIEDGYLAPLISKASAAEIDVSSVQRRGGEFVSGSLEAAAMDDDLVRKAVDETLKFGADRRSWLIFCSGVKHAAQVRDAMKARGVTAAMVTGETPHHERDRIIRDFRSGAIRCLTNANVLTTGFDAPATDLVVMLRPTLSTGLYVQIVGRGTRVVWPVGFRPDLATAEERRAAIASSPKANCLVLDFAGNVRRHGPVDAVEVEEKRAKKGEDGKVAVDTVNAKECPSCEMLVALNTATCKHCGHEWPKDAKAKHEAEADGVSGILSSEPVRPAQIPLVDWSLRRWSKASEPFAPETVRVTYIAGVQSASEWICPEHDGFAGRKAVEWWGMHGGEMPAPKTAVEAVERAGELIMPATITLRPDGRFLKVAGRSFPPRAPPPAGPDRQTVTLRRGSA
jgi:DNA repair protein RadD